MSSGAIKATPSDDRGGWASGPGRRWAFLAAAVAALAAAAVVVILIAGGGGSTTSRPAQAALKFGHLPSWLPKITTPKTPQYEVATASSPMLSEEQGFTVHAVLPTGTADVMAEGPAYPAYVANYANAGQWPASKLVPSTFYVTFTNVKGTIPIAANAFSVENSNYQHIAATLSVKGGGKVPSSIQAGRPVTLEVHTKTLAGQGAVAWSPLTGGKTLVAWIYQLELN